MFKTILIQLIRKRNPQFEMDSAVNSYLLQAFIQQQFWCLLRGFRTLLWLRLPKGLMLGEGVRFFNIPRIHYGRFLRLGSHVYVSALGRQGVVFGHNVSIGAFSRIVVSTSLHHLGEGIRIGNHVGIGEYAYLGGGGGLEIGDECIVGQYFSCHPENHQFGDLATAIRFQGVTRKGIKVGSNCWIGSKVTLLDGVELGEGCVVAAGSVVTQSFPANSVIGGVPAKLLKKRTHEK